MSLAVDPPEVEWVFYVLDGDADPPLYSFELVDADTERERPLFSRTGDTAIFHTPDSEAGEAFERHEPSDDLRLAVARAAEGTVPPEQMDALPAWEADFLACAVNTINDDPDGVPWGVHRWIDDCCAEYRGAVESASLDAYDDGDTGE